MSDWNLVGEVKVYLYSDLVFLHGSFAASHVPVTTALLISSRTVKSVAVK